LKGIAELNGANAKVKAGQCPHGLPAGACPVCSMSGGGGSFRPDKPRKPGEMTYHECAMIGNMMRARELARKTHEQGLKEHALKAQQFEQILAKFIQNVKAFNLIMSKSFLTKPVAFLARMTVLPMLNIIKNIHKILQTLNNIRFEITDKLNAIYGEAKAFLLKKTEEAAKVMSAFFEKIFKTSKKNDAEDEDTKIDDDKKIFNLKTMIKKVKEKFKHKKDKKQ